jgi:hypothetical protein
MFAEIAGFTLVIDTIAGGFLQQEHTQNTHKNFFHAILLPFARVGNLR